MKKILWSLLFAFVFVGTAVSAQIYTIQKGDTLNGIAANQGISLAELVELNNIENPDLIYEGTNLLLSSDAIVMEDDFSLGAISRPELFFDTSLSRGLAVGGSETEIYVATLPTETTGYVVINPFSSTNRELIKYTGVTTTGGNQLTGATRALAFVGTTGVVISDARVAANAKRHSSGESVVMSNGRYEQLIIDQLNGLSTTSLRGTDFDAFYFEYLPTVSTTNLTATQANQLVTKDLLDATAIQGAPTGTEAVIGLVELGTQLEMASSTFLGTADPLVLQTRYATSTPTFRGLYIPISENDGYLSQDWFRLTDTYTGSYAWSGPWAWTATTTFATSTFTSSSIDNITINNVSANNLVGDNDADSLHYHNDMIMVTSTNVTINTTSFEPFFTTTTIPANTLRTGGAIRARVYLTEIDIENTRTSQFLVRYGTTGGITMTLLNETGIDAFNYTGYIEAEIIADGATNAQVVNLNYFAGNGSPTSTMISTAVGTFSLDSTVDQNFVIEGSAESGGNKLVSDNAYIEIIR